MLAFALEPASIVERPVLFPARGVWEAPAWVIVLLGAVAIVLGSAYLYARARRRRS
jgi:hypothetical protein